MLQNIKLRLPLRDIYVTQIFGVNLVDFYQKYFNPPLLGHPGVDFRAKNGCKVYASHDGIVLFAGINMPDGGKMVSIWDENNNFKTIYYHLDTWLVESGKKVKAGDVIGLADNTGKMTTGSHLHTEIKETDKNGATLNTNNGYGGCQDISKFYCYTYNGIEIKNKDWNRSRCYHRYYREAKRNLANEMKVALYMARRLKRLPTNEEINACVWGGWDIETVMNEGMWEIWGQLKKDEWQRGIKSFT